MTTNPGQDIYLLQFPDITGKPVTMANYKKKKIIVTVFNAKSPDLGYLKYLNQMQSKWPNLKIMAIPALDFAGRTDIQTLNSVKTREGIGFIFTRPAYIKKDNAQQHPLMKWITNKEMNLHFDDDVDITEKLFFISEAGILYGSLDKSASPETILKTLGQKIN
jgi:glutathione peroxidase